MLLQSTNRRWEEWQGDNRAKRLKRSPNTLQAGSYEALSEVAEGWEGCFQAGAGISMTPLSLETALSSFLHLNLFAPGTNKLTT